MKSPSKSLSNRPPSSSSSALSSSRASVLPPASSLPPLPGVYWFLSSKKEVLYVGKAKNLKNRLAFYHRLKNLQTPKTSKMLHLARQVKWRRLNSELEASLVEAQLIKRYQPKYNSRLKDDKSPLYIVITREKFPRVLARRKTDLKNDPPLKTFFGPFSSGFKTRQILKISRRLFPYCNQKRSRKKHACFYYHLSLCPGVCAQKINQQDYNQIIKRLQLFLQGKTKTIIKDWQKQMRAQAKNLQFEEANLIKQKIQNLLYLNQSQSLSPDLTIPVLSDDLARQQIKSLKELLLNHSLIKPENKLARIEAYDVSNLSGKKATGSMVVFTNGQPAKNHYRRFRIRFKSAPDDLAMIKEVLARRLYHPEWGIPDLMIIDGGKPQLLAAAQVIKAQVPLLGIAKRPDRLVLPTPEGFVYHHLEKDRKEAQLIAAIRNEAHRFALAYHRKLRQIKLERKPN